MSPWSCSRITSLFASQPVARNGQTRNYNVHYVKLSQIAEDVSEILLDIILPDELFGVSALVNGPHRGEQTTALENAKLMIWSVSAMEDLVTKRPRVAVSLLQISAQRIADYAHRLKSTA
jgi:CRP-like cAMP-binding protein